MFAGKDTAEGGIKVLKEWEDFKTFQVWALENGYKKGLHIDRKENDGNYEPTNCRFITLAENNRNTSLTKLNWPKVMIMRSLYKTGLISKKELALLFEISSQHCGMVVMNRAWVT